LWQAVLGRQTTLFTPPQNTMPAQIDAERSWLVLPITDLALTAVTQADLARLVALLAPGNDDRLILDTL
jgi:hypothetical protein